MMGPRRIALLLAGGLSGLAVAAQAQAQGVDQRNIELKFRGIAPAGCQLSTPAGSTGNASVAGHAPGSVAISLDRLIDAGGRSRGATAVLVLPAMCNQAHTLRLSSAHGGLRRDDAAASSGTFRDQATYRVTVSWSGQQETFATDNGELLLTKPRAVADDVVLTIEVPASDAPLTAGAYGDELVLQLSAAG